MLKKLLKYTGYFFAGIIVFVLLMVIALNLVSDEQYKNWITSVTQSATGRTLFIENFELKLGSHLQIKATNIRMANAPWAEQKYMLQLAHLEADIGLLPLLYGKADIRFVVKKTDVLVENNAEGISNLAMGSGKQEAEDTANYETDKDRADDDRDTEITGLLLDPVIREIRFEDVTFTRVMKAGIAAKITHFKQLLIETPEQDTTITLVANANGHPVEVSGSLGDIEQFLYKSSEPVKLNADIDGNLLTINGNWGPLFPKQIMQLDVALKIPSTSGLAEAFNMEIGEFEDVNIIGKLIGNGDALALGSLEVTLDDPMAVFSMRGSIANLINMKGISIAVDASTEKLNTLMQQLNVGLSVPLPTTVVTSANISGSLNELALSNLKININDEGIDVNATVSIGDLLHAQKITGKVVGTIDRLSQLSKFVDMNLPSLGVLHFSGNLSSNDKALEMNDLNITISSDDINLSVTGKVEDLLTVSGIDALAKADISSFSKQNISELTTLFKQFDIEIPVNMLPQSLSFNAGIQGNLEQLSLVDMQGEALDKGLKIGLSGEVGNVLALTGIDVKLSLDSNNVAALSKYAGTELPDTDPLKVLLTLKEDNAKRPNFIVHAETGDIKVDINGALESLSLPGQLALNISVKAKSIAAFNQLAQQEFPDVGPFDISGNLKIQKNYFAVNKLKVQLKDESATGNLTIKLPVKGKSSMAINGNIDIAYLNLNFLLPDVEEGLTEKELTAVTRIDASATTKAEMASSTAKVTTDRIFSTEPNIGKNLKNHDIDLTINAEKIKFGKANMKDVEITVLLKNGLLRLDPIKGTGGAGNIDGIIQIDASKEIPELKVDITILQMPTPNLGGKLDFDADLVGQGKSIAELMASLNGNALVVMRDGRIEGALVQKMGSGLLSFSKEKNYTTLECGILRVDIKDGIADFEKNLAAQLTEVTWRGGGIVNLKTEELEVGIKPKPRKGIPISLSGSLSGLVFVGGTLKNPKVQLDPKDIAVKYAKYSAYVASGGITFLVEKIKDKIQANQDICKKIIDGSVFDEAEKEKAKKKTEKIEKNNQ